jgi:hypothetical protein
MGLNINDDKTKYMVTEKSTTLSPTISVSYNFHKVESFVYLGTVVNSVGGVMMEIKARLGTVNKCYFGLMKLLSSKLLSASFINQQLGQYSYGSETWALGIQGENLLKYISCVMNMML